jgi:hypothetical protein
MGCYPHFILPMRRSRGFASTAANSDALFGLAFASAPGQRPLTLLTTVSRRIIMQKARRHTGLRHRAPTACRHVVSGSLSSPWWGFFPSFARATGFAIGRQGVLSLAGWAPQIRAGFHVSGPTQVPNHNPSPAAYGTITLFGRTFQTASARVQGCLRLVLQPHPDESGWFGLFRFRSPLLTESLLLSFPGGTEMFQFPPFAPYTYGFSVRSFGYPGLKARLTAPPGLSQSSTPFIAFWRLDIPHTPLVA